MSSGRSTDALKRQRKAEALEAKHEARAVQGLTEIPPPPESLGPKGKHVWQVFMRERFRTITETELEVVERYAALNDRRHELLGILKKTGWSGPGSRPSMVVIRPEATMLAAAETELRQMERVLSIGATHRARLQMDILAVESELAKANARHPPLGSQSDRDQSAAILTAITEGNSNEH